MRQSRFLPYGLLLCALVACWSWHALGTETAPAQDEVHTLEDLFGDTGNTFQASIGFINTEGTPTNQAQQSYGIGIDDLVIKWREFTLAEDATDCAISGSCATIELATTNVFEGQSVLTVTVLESTPDAENDCDLDGTPDGTDDCNGNAIPDVVVRASSEVDVAGEILHLDRTDTPTQYRGTVLVSSLAGGPGVVFIADQGGEDPTVTVTYRDNDDGTGHPCPNHVNPANHGNIVGGTTVFLEGTCEIAFLGAEIADNGDRDDFADTNETVEMRPTLINNCGYELHNCTARISTTSPEVDCIFQSVIDLGDLPDGEVVTAVEPWVWKVADVHRSDVNQDLSASFTVTALCDQLGGLSVPQTIELPLDLTLDDNGQSPQPWVEGFETGTLGKFEPENLDAGIPGQNNSEGLINGDGYRCQYHNPDWPTGGSYGSDEALHCFPGASLEQSNAVFWQVDGQTTGSPDGGRAWSGDYSMYYGVYLTDPSGNFTSPAAVIESVRTTDPINLTNESAELSFWHQNSLLDGRILTIDPIWSADRGVVSIQLADEVTGDPISEWIRLEPFQNSYDTQAFRNFFNCMFDPIDDGNDEDDFFDPTDPGRSEGPSSTCYPGFNYSCMGDTLNPFSTENVCNATTAPLSDESPAASGGFGTGTWVKSRVDLTGYKGRRVRIRFLVSSLKVPAEHWEAQFMNNPNPGDDGWWIDQVEVDKTFENPVALIVDENVVRGCAGDPDIGCLTDQDCVDAGTSGPCDQPAPACGETCTLEQLEVHVATDPDATPGTLVETLAAPGRPIELNAVGSIGQCLSGSLQYRFSIVGGSELRTWSDNPILIDAPRADTDYLVEVRCSMDTSCMESVVVDVDVECPASGNLAGPFQTVRASAGPEKDSFEWSAPSDYELFSGPLGWVSEYLGSITDAGTGTSFPAPAVPSSGEGIYYVVRIRGEYCNDTGPWSSGGPVESPLREESMP